MIPYTKKEKNKDDAIKRQKYHEHKSRISETTCEHCGISIGYDRYPYRCEIDEKRRDCEGKCQYYEPRLSVSAHLSRFFPDLFKIIFGKE